MAPTLHVSWRQAAGTHVLEPQAAQSGVARALLAPRSRPHTCHAWKLRWLHGALWLVGADVALSLIFDLGSGHLSIPIRGDCRQSGAVSGTRRLLKTAIGMSCDPYTLVLSAIVTRDHTAKRQNAPARVSSLNGAAALEGRSATPLLCTPAARASASRSSP